MNSRASASESRQSPDTSNLLAAALVGSWRDLAASEIQLSAEDLDQITPLLYESGAAALGWWSIRHTDLRHTPSGQILHQAFRLLALQAEMHEPRIQKVFRVMRAAGIEPILIKGWAVARSYPQLALRPYGDIDLIVRPRDYAAAAEVTKAEARECLADLHAPGFELVDRTLDELFGRSLLVPCGGEQVRVLSPEDHFALLAIHFLKHGGWRPLWLCDLALLLESMSAEFDWQVCLGKNKRRANWIVAAAALAHVLLQASINDEQIAARARELPSWLVQSVLKQWETPFALAQAPISHPTPIRAYFRHPRGLLSELSRRWPNPITATISVNGMFGARRRLRYEVGNWLLRGGRILVHGSGAGRPVIAGR